MMYLKGVEGDTPKYAVPILETDFSDLPSHIRQSDHLIGFEIRQ